MVLNPLFLFHWRKCMGIEPTYQVLARYTGFEVREPHQ
jgi:hypothetical protein